MRAIGFRGIRVLLVLAAFAVATPAFADVREAVLASHAAMVKEGKFRSHNQTTDKKGTRESHAEVVWPDRFHVTNAEMELIILPGKTWIKQGGQWQPFPMNLSQMIGQLTPDAMKQGYDNMTNARELPEAKVGDRTARVFEYDTSAKVMGIEAKSHVKVFIDKENNLPLKQVADGTAMGHTSTTTTTYEYDPSIRVEAP